MSMTAGTVQTIILRDGDRDVAHDGTGAAPQSAQDAHAYFAVVTHAELQQAITTPGLFLSDVELKVWQTLRVENKRQSALQGRIAAKRSLGAALGEADLRKIEIERGSFGQPLVRYARAAGFEVTLSHSHGLAVALAYPDALPMGLDLEAVPLQSAETVLGELQLSEAERRWLDAAEVDRATACGMLWSLREALGKSMKTGLNCPLGILAAARFEKLDAQRWIAHYVNFPQSWALVQVIDRCVLSLALPCAVTPDPWPQLPRPSA